MNNAMPVITDIPMYVDTITDYLSTVESAIPIVVTYCKSWPAQYILYNSEQLTRAGELERIVATAQQPGCVEVWDYSAENVAILATRGITAKHMPLRSSSAYLERLQFYRNQGQLFDIGFCGSLNDRRRAILDRIAQTGVSICITTQWGEGRDRMLAACKTILNIHYADDYQVFESARCEPWLALGIPVISEHSRDNDPRCINVAYDQLVETIKDYVNGIPR